MSELSISQPETVRIGRMVASSFERDKPDFISFSPRFADPFIAGYMAMNEEIAALPTTKAINSELKATTNRIKAMMHLFTADMNKIESLIKLATGKLTIDRKDFGIKLVREAVSSNKVPELEAAMNNLMNNVRANIQPLTAVGLTAAFLTDLEARVKAVSTESVLQHSIISRRGETSQNNAERYEAFRAIMKLIMVAGKAINKGTNPNKTKDYTLSYLRRKHYAAQNSEDVKPKEKSNELVEASV